MFLMRSSMVTPDILDTKHINTFDSRIVAVIMVIFGIQHRYSKCKNERSYLHFAILAKFLRLITKILLPFEIGYIFFNHLVILHCLSFETLLTKIC